MRNKKVDLIVRTALFMALTLVVTLFVSMAVGTGNVNMGDTVILVGALFLPAVPLGFAGAIGAMIADLIAFPVFAPYTLVIKFLEGLLVGLLFQYFKKVIKKENVAFLTASAIAVLMIPVGYFFANWIAYSSVSTGFADIPQELVQASISLVVANLLFYPLSKDLRMK